MTESFSYTQVHEASGVAGWVPLLEVGFDLAGSKFYAGGLLDSGATVNVLPWELGLLLGLGREQQQIPVRLTGNLAQADAYAVVLETQVASFEPVKLAYAWTRIPGSRLLLGQINFFREFDVRFFGSEHRFELSRR